MNESKSWEEQDVDNSYMTDTVATTLGVLLAFMGVWGLYSHTVLKVFTTNTLHAFVHIALGVAGVALGLASKSRAYCLGVGALLLGVGVLRFVPGVSSLAVAAFNVNVPVALLNITLGAVALFTAWISTRPPVLDRAYA